ncbi:hypothetical protein BH09BAC3_BH09BAC3_37420 [soil metagenome]
MKRIHSILLLVMVSSIGYGQIKSNVMKKETVGVTCKLTTPELQERKVTVIAEVKKLVVERNETKTGMRYKFNDSDKTIDLLTSFIKTERLCCDFFIFTLVIGREEGSVWLDLSGPEGTKDFIETEIGF